MENSRDESNGLVEIQVRGKVIKRVPMSLFCCSHKLRLRKTVAFISEDRIFETLIIIFIFANCICMASRDYMDKDDRTIRNKYLNYVDFVFSFVFVIEAIFKIITSGFVFGKKTYLRKPWNVMDFIIVLAALFDVFMEILSLDSETLSALKSARVLRVLRPLKALKTSPSLRQQVSTLLKSLT